MTSGYVNNFNHLDIRNAEICVQNNVHWYNHTNCANFQFFVRKQQNPTT